MRISKQSSDVDFQKIMTELKDEKKKQDNEKFNKIKAKVMTVARFNRMLKNAKENSSALAEFKKVSHDGKLPKGALLQTVEETKSDINQFLALRKLDSENEKFPHLTNQIVIKRRESEKMAKRK